MTRRFFQEHGYGAPNAANSDTQAREGFGSGAKRRKGGLSLRGPTSPTRRLPSGPGIRVRHTHRMNRRRALGLLLGGGALAFEVGGVAVAGRGVFAQAMRALQPPPPAGSVIGHTTQPRNTAVIFVNPLDGQQSMLIRLPNGTFAACERACTHRGVYLDYDPKTHLLVCPAHGALFDPAQHFKVVLGPATVAQPPVAFQTAPDGSSIVIDKKGHK